MNVLFFASDYKIGISSLLTDQLISLHKYGGVTIQAISGENEQEVGLYKKISQEIEITRINGLDSHSNFITIANKISDIIKNNNFEIIHVQNNWQLVLVSFCRIRINKRQKPKVIYTLHGFRHNNFLKSIIAQIIIGILLLLFTDRIIYMSDYVRKKFILVSYKMSKIYLGIEEAFFSKNNNSIQLDSLKLVFPAQFRHGKNQDVIIRAFSKYCLEKHDTKSSLSLPGSGELEQKLKKLAIKLGIEQQVIFQGQLSKKEIKNLYENSNIGIISSNSETFGQSIVEPYVLGRCVISTKVGVAPEIIIEGINGFLYVNEDELYNILISLSNDMSQVYNCGMNNFNSRNKFTWEVCSRNIINLYLNI